MKKITISAAFFAKLLAKLPQQIAEEFKAFTEGEADAELTQDQMDKLTSGLGSLLSITDAPNHPEVKKALKFAALKPVDDALAAYLTAAGLSAEEIEAVTKGKEAPEKVKAAFDKVADLTKKASGKTSTERETEWIAAKQKLEQDAKDALDKYNAEVAARNEDQVNFALDTYLGSSEFTWLDGLPRETQIRVVKQDLMQAVNGKKAQLKYDPTAKKLQVLDAEGNVYHEPGTATPFELKTLAANVQETLGFKPKQGGEFDKKDFLPPVPGGQTGPQIDEGTRAAARANHELIQKSLAEQQ